MLASPARPSAGPRARRLPRSAWMVLAGLLAFLATQYPAVLAVPFINDDYLFLDKTRSMGFLALWRLEDLNFHWYRPWSRELHYWALQRLFGPHEIPFHLASLALWLAVLMSFAALVRRIAGAGAAAVAVPGMAGLAAWGVPLLWVAGVQELWMLLFGLLSLHAWTAGRPWRATAALAGALLSKETAAVLAPIALAYSLAVERQRPARALRAALPLLSLTALWALVHPVLGGRLWRPLNDPLEPGAEGQGPLLLWSALRVALNADALPRPEQGWTSALLQGAFGALILATVAAAALRAARAPAAPGGGTRSGRARAGDRPGSSSDPARPAPSAHRGPLAPAAERRLLGFGALWALLGWAPLLMPSLGWHVYYALLGSCGVWLALGTVLARRPRVAVALVAVVALIRPARADTPSLDWGSEWYQRRAAEFMRVMRTQLLQGRPRVAPHTRLFFVRVPSNVGFIAGDGPALRVWYGEPTLRAGFYSSYRPRRPDEPAGSDLFFRFDSTGGWVEVMTGPEDVAAARRLNPRWERDHVTLAATFARAGDWRRAAAEYAKLAGEFPSRVDYAFDAGVCLESAGDSSAAARWYARAAGLPGADPEVQRSAARLARHLRGPLPSD